MSQTVYKPSRLAGYPRRRPLNELVELDEPAQAIATGSTRPRSTNITLTNLRSLSSSGYPSKA